MTIKVKFIGRGGWGVSAEIWTRQIPGGHRIRDYEFDFDHMTASYDWLVVYDDMPRFPNQRRTYFSEDLRCSAAQTILITSEPSRVRRYPQLFRDQFNYIISSQEPQFLRHSGHIFTQAGLRWYYGVGSKKLVHIEEMIAHPPLEKTENISTVVSTKKQRHTLHARRVAFIETLARGVPDLQRFGHGVRVIDDKAETLDPFRYHIAIENHISPHHWTEKLSDAFLGCTLPFYIGAPNVFDYFPQDSLIPLDLDDPEGSREIIAAAIANREWEKRLPAILEARKRVLERYGLFQNLAAILDAIRAKPIEIHHHNQTGRMVSANDARKQRPVYSFIERIRNLDKFLPSRPR